VFIDVEEGENCPDSLQLVFSALDGPRDVRQVRLYHESDLGALYDVVAWHNEDNAPSRALGAAVEDASQICYERPAAFMGEGGTIPFMGMLGKQFPDAQFLITGVLGPHSNAHGPNEFLHIPYAKRLTACVAHVLAAHAARG